MIEKRYHNIPGATFRQQTDHRFVLQLNSAEGTGMMKACRIFPGVLLSFNHFRIPASPVLATQNQDKLLLNYCKEGRCEVNLGKGTYLYVKTGDLSVDTKPAREQFVFPLSLYEGIELFLDLDILHAIPPGMFREAGIQVSGLREKLCPNNKSFLMRTKGRIERVLTELYEEQSLAREGYLRLKTTGLLLLLNKVEDDPEMEPRSYFTKAQVTMAKQVREKISRNLKHHYPIETLAREYGVSATSLTNYFRGVYGKNISAYLKETRMAEAAKSLRETNRLVSDIAEWVGYENQSKFAAVFKASYGESPLEYRRKVRCNTLEDTEKGKENGACKI